MTQFQKKSIFSLYTDYHSFSNACGASDYYDPMCVCIRQVIWTLKEEKMDFF